MADTAKKKRLPRKCECGGKLIYEFDFGLTFCHCDTCTPVQKIDMKKIRAKLIKKGIIRG